MVFSSRAPLKNYCFKLFLNFHRVSKCIKMFDSHRGSQAHKGFVNPKSLSDYLVVRQSHLAPRNPNPVTLFPMAASS